MKTEQKYHTIEELVDLSRADMVKVNAEYQRGEVWNLDSLVTRARVGLGGGRYRPSHWFCSESGLVLWPMLWCPYPVRARHQRVNTAP